MSENFDSEAYIPFRRRQLVDLCINDGKLSPEDQKIFRRFCEILSAYFHYDFQEKLEKAKRAYMPLNPDIEAKPVRSLAFDEILAFRKQLAEISVDLLEDANFTKLPESDLNHALESESLVPLKTYVDFDDYEQVLVYYRGEKPATLTIKRLFRKKEIQVRNLTRVALLLAFKDKEHFESKSNLKDIEELGFIPGKTYLYLYKNVPRSDLELLFPNVEVAMSAKDRTIFALPALGAIVPIMMKIVPSLALLAAAILVFTIGSEGTRQLGFNVKDSGNIYPVLAAALSVGAGLGGFAVKQYLNYKNKRLKFLKKVTDTLFFKCLVTNEGVLHTLTDATEEEISKEVILIYYHLLTGTGAITPDQLDEIIENWLESKFSGDVDFDIQKGLAHLRELSAVIDTGDGKAKSKPILVSDKDGMLNIAGLQDALGIVDTLWDNAFPYSGHSAARR